MKTVAITGGIGTGKSTTATVLQQLGYSVIETDELARRVVEPGQPTHALLLQEFGPEFFDDSGHLKRDLVAELVFSNEHARRRLESITHPAIYQICKRELTALNESGCTLAFVVVPLLYEVDWAAEFNYVICVACTTQTQWARLRMRGLSDQQIRGRLSAQWPLEKKMELADFVVWTEGSFELYRLQLERILKWII